MDCGKRCFAGSGVCLCREMTVWGYVSRGKSILGLMENEMAEVTKASAGDTCYFLFG